MSRVGSSILAGGSWTVVLAEAPFTVAQGDGYGEGVAYGDFSAPDG